MVVKRRTKQKLLVIGLVLAVAFVIAIGGAGAWGRRLQFSCSYRIMGWCSPF